MRVRVLASIATLGMGNGPMGQIGGGMQHVHFALGMHTSFTVVSRS